MLKVLTNCAKKGYVKGNSSLPSLLLYQNPAQPKRLTRQEITLFAIERDLLHLHQLFSISQPARQREVQRLIGAR
jgi:hypothetical protein